MEEGISLVAVKELREGKFVMIDGVPCKVVALDISHPGKHGSAKARITAIAIFDDSKHTIIKPSHSEIEVPVIKKKRAQVVSVSGDVAQLMDSETYEVFDVSIGSELRGKVTAGAEAEIIEAAGRRMLSRMLS